MFTKRKYMVQSLPSNSMSWILMPSQTKPVPSLTSVIQRLLTGLHVFCRGCPAVFSQNRGQSSQVNIRQFTPLSCLKSCSGFFWLQPDTQWPSRPNMIQPLISKSFTLFLAHSFLFTLGSFLFGHVVPTLVPLHMIFPLFNILF